MNRKQTRAEVDGQTQKSIPMYLQAPPCQCFERMSGKRTLIKSHALRWGDVSLRNDPVTGNKRQFLKVFSSIAYQYSDQEQREHPVQPGAERLNKFFATEARKSHSLSKSEVIFASIAGVILDKLMPWSIPSRVFLLLLFCVIGAFIITIINKILEKNRALPLKNNRGREVMTGNRSALRRLLDG